jgi:hypothetical protein
VAASVNLLDVLAEDPTVAALKAQSRRSPGDAPPRKFLDGNFHSDAAGIHADVDDFVIKILHPRDNRSFLVWKPYDGSLYRAGNGGGLGNTQQTVEERRRGPTAGEGLQRGGNAPQQRELEVAEAQPNQIAEETRDRLHYAIEDREHRHDEQVLFGVVK